MIFSACVKVHATCDVRTQQQSAVHELHNTLLPVDISVYLAITYLSGGRYIIALANNLQSLLRLEVDIIILFYMHIILLNLEVLYLIQDYEDLVHFLHDLEFLEVYEKCSD